MQCFVMNTRRKVFENRLVREAMTYAFDFEWENKNLFFGLYTRTDSFFSNSDFASSGLPTGAELALLEPFRGKVPDEVFTTEFKLPVTDGSGNNREGLKRALGLLREAGWEVKERKLVDVSRPADDVRDPARRAGVRARRAAVRAMAGPPWHRRARAHRRSRAIPAPDRCLRLRHDGDRLRASPTAPATSSADIWTLEAAKAPGSDNLAGVSDPVVDALVAKLISAHTRDSLIAATCRALDRVLLWGWYVMPKWHVQSFRAAWLGPIRPSSTCRSAPAPTSTPGGSMRRWRPRPTPRGRAGCDVRAHTSAPALMGAYLVRRLLLVIPTLFGIIAINFAVVQFAPGGPVEQMIDEIWKGKTGEMPGVETGAGRRRRRRPKTAPIAARAAWTRRAGANPQDVRLRQAAAGALRADAEELPDLRLRQQLLPRQAGAGTDRREDAGLRSRSACGRRCWSTSSRSRSASPRPCATARGST